MAKKERSALSITAHRIYREMIDSRGSSTFDVSDVHLAVLKAAGEYQDSVLAEAVRLAVKEADEGHVGAQCRPSQQSEQKELFDTVGAYALDKGRRVGKRFALREHMVKALAINDKNLDSQVKANARMHDEFNRLRPFWAEGVPKEQAIALYRESNPNAA